MYAAFEQTAPNAPKRRALADTTFASLADAIEYFSQLGGFAEIDAENDAADVFTKGGTILTVEAL